MSLTPCYIKPMSSGTHKAWQLIKQRAPAELCSATGVSHDGACYGIHCLGADFLLCPDAHGGPEVMALDDRARELYGRAGFYFDHSVICYVASGQSVGRTGKLLKPASLPGGNHFFTRGTHVLPLGSLAEKYAGDTEGFVRAGLALGGHRVGYGDAAVELTPLPSLPVVLILWSGSDEFPARADLLFDSSAAYVAALDVIWSSAMLVLGAMGAEVEVP